MATTTQHGYLVLADISGYTSYLAGVELDHAHEILTDLLTTVVTRFKALITISKLEGDAVFGYLSETKLTRGETLLELAESTYGAFQDRIKSSHRHTTCQCRACQNMTSLDLKFFIHHGDYIVQDVAGIRELVGSDVNLIHRLTKNHIAEATGWKAYVLLTEKALTHLALSPDQLHTQTESYEHLGDTATFSFDLRERYQAMMATRRVVVEPAQACISNQFRFAAPPPVVWEWLNDPDRRVQYALTPGIKFTEVLRPGGRRGAGAKTHCVHGKELAMEETVLDWKPFEYLTVEQRFMGFVMKLTMRLEPAEEGRGTVAYMTIDGTSRAPGPLSRPVFAFFIKSMFPMEKMFQQMGRCIESGAASPAVLAAAAH